MKVLLYTHGTRGDVQPYLALAVALRDAGHEVVLCAPAALAPLAAGRRIAFVPRGNGFLELIHQAEYREILEDGEDTDPRERETRIRDLARQVRDTVYPSLLEGLAEAGSDGADLVVHRFDQAHHVAEWLGVPAVLGLLHPHHVPSWHYPGLLGGKAPGSSRLANRWGHLRLRLRGDGGPLRRLVEDWRADKLRLPRRRGMHDRFRQADGSPVPVLHGFSRHVAEPASDWPSWVHTTGFWFLPPMPDPEGVDERLSRFVSAGDPPVFFGLGSLLGADPRRTGRIVLDTVETLGLRAVIVTGAGGIDIPDPPDHVLVTGEVPYPWLFPRMRAAVHAGGVGTTHEALAAGLPQVTCPFHAEQYGWGDRLHRRGSASRPIWQGELTARALGEALHRILTDQKAEASAADLRDRIRHERGVQRAVERLEIVHHSHQLRRRT